MTKTKRYLSYGASSHPVQAQISEILNININKHDKKNKNRLYHPNCKDVNLDRSNPDLKPILDRCILDKQIVLPLESILFEPRGQTTDSGMQLCSGRV